MGTSDTIYILKFLKAQLLKHFVLVWYKNWTERGKRVEKESLGGFNTLTEADTYLLSSLHWQKIDPIFNKNYSETLTPI